MYFNFDEFWQEHKISLPSDIENIEECCRRAWEAGVNREKIRTDDIIEFLKKELMHKSSFKNVMKKENRELKAKLKNLYKQIIYAQNKEKQK